jgi:hypothetical protein
LKMLFKKDEEFKSWLQDQPHNGNHPQNGEGSVIENAKNT